MTEITEEEMTAIDADIKRDAEKLEMTEETIRAELETMMDERKLDIMGALAVWESQHNFSSKRGEFEVVFLGAGREWPYFKKDDDGKPTDEVGHHQDYDFMVKHEDVGHKATMTLWNEDIEVAGDLVVGRTYLVKVWWDPSSSKMGFERDEPKLFIEQLEGEDMNELVESMKTRTIADLTTTIVTGKLKGIEASLAGRIGEMIPSKDKSTIGFYLKQPGEVPIQVYVNGDFGELDAGKRVKAWGWFSVNEGTGLGRLSGKGAWVLQ